MTNDRYSGKDGLIIGYNYHGLIDGEPIAFFNDGVKKWYQNGLLHRLDGPAIEYPNGDREWWQNDQLHRLGGPAIECVRGTKCWFQNGLRHRLDGPAMHLSNNIKLWYINGKYFTKEEFEKTILVMQLSGLLYG